MKIGVFGGSFNPVHNGHINLVENCRDIENLDKVLLVPTNIPPHKTNRFLASNEDRFNMLKLAVKDISWIEVSDIEYNLGGVSYTVNTLKELKKYYKNDEIYFIMGSDMFLTFSQWVQYEKILQTVKKILVASRHEQEYNILILEKKKYKGYEEKIDILNVKVIDVSSTEIREELKNNCKPAELNEDVYNYIIEKNIY